MINQAPVWIVKSLNDIVFRGPYYCRAYATALQLSVVSHASLCIVAKRLNGASSSKSYLLLSDSLPIGSSIREIDLYQNEWPWPLVRGCLRSCQPSHSPLNIADTVRDSSLVPISCKRTTNRKWPTGFKWRWRYVTGLKGPTRDPNTLRAQNSWRYRLRSKRPPIGNSLWGCIKWTRDRWRNVTSKGQTRDPNS